MPLSKYDSVFGGKEGSAAKARASMLARYGEEEGERIFYSTVAKRKREGNPRGLRDAVNRARKRKRWGDAPHR